MGTLGKEIGFSFVVFISDVVIAGLLVAIPLVFIVLFPLLDLMVVNRSDLFGCFCHSRIIHHLFLRVFEDLVGLFDEFELLKGARLLVVVGVVLSS